MEPVKQTFPFKLYHTIEWASDSEFSSALTWSQTGNAFVVHDRDVVVEHIIPKFFDHQKWRSFTRQLNLWGFKRELRGPNTEGERYYHPHFNRGKLEELQLIRRTEIKRRSSKKQLSSHSHDGSQSSLTHQLPLMTANQNDSFKILGATSQETGDIKQGASFLTGLKGVPDNMRLLPGGGFPAAANYMQGPSQMNSIMSFKTSSFPPSMQSQMMQSQLMNPQLQHQMLMQQQMMRQPHFISGYPTQGNWNPSQINREMFSQMSNQQLAAMASMNGMSSMYNNNGNNMNGLNMLHSNQTSLGCNLNDAHSTLVSVGGSSLRDSLSSSLSSAPAHLDASEGEVASNSLAQPLPRAA